MRINSTERQRFFCGIFSLLFINLLVCVSLASASPLKSDEEIIFFPTAASFDETTSQWQLPINGWIFERETNSLWRRGAVKMLMEALEIDSPPGDEALFKKRAWLFLADSEGGKDITVRIGLAEYPLPASGANGRIKDSVSIPIKERKEWGEGKWISYSALVPEEDGRRFEGRVQLVGPEGISVISDIDDTIKESNVLDKKELLANTFFRKFRPVSGMSKAYRRWAQEGAVFHYLSSSPWQLYPSLREFMAREGFPAGSFHLQDFRLKDRSFFNLFRSPEESKIARIEEIIRLYPRRSFILVGDSGEKDPEVYGTVARRYPGRISAVFIRRVQGGDNSSERFDKAFEGLPEWLWTLFDAGDELYGSDISKVSKSTDVKGGGMEGECVVLLHGMARSRLSMWPMEVYLKRSGYKTINRGYPSTERSIEEIAEKDVAGAVKECRSAGARKIHFVTHSLGGIVVRQYLQTNSVPEGSRMVMLGPPNRGSELADNMKDLTAYKWLNGPAGQELGTDDGSMLKKLKPVPVEVGVIAGDISLNPLYSSMIPGPDDGKVSVENTKLDEMRDFIVIAMSHTFMMNRPDVMEQVLHFLEHGRFDHGPGITPFTSDGCSLFPDGSLEERNLWCSCCLEHDIAYWRGGTEEVRLAADGALRDCVKEKTGSEELAELMYSGVRLGGSPVFPTWYRWGYGWPYGRGYRALSETELKSVEKRLTEYRKSNAPYTCGN